MIMELKREGKSVKEIARIFEVGPRMAQRAPNAVTARKSLLIAKGVEDICINPLIPP